MYKNWGKICKIKDRHFMWAIAFLDMTSDLGGRIIASFPEYFTKKESKKIGPIPESVIREQARVSGIDFSDAMEVFGIPLFEFNKDKKRIPKKINGWLEDHGEMETITYREKILLCIHVMSRGDWSYFVPADCVGVGL